MIKEGTVDIFFHETACEKDALYEIRDTLIDAGFVAGVVKSGDGHTVSITGEGILIQERFVERASVRICLPVYLAKEEFTNLIKKRTVLARRLREQVTALFSLSKECEEKQDIVIHYYEQLLSGYIRWWNFSIDPEVDPALIDYAFKHTYASLELIKGSLAKEYIAQVRQVDLSFDHTEKQWKVMRTQKDIPPLKTMRTNDDKESEVVKTEVTSRDETEQYHEESRKSSLSEVFLLVFPERRFWQIVNPIVDVRSMVSLMRKFIREGEVTHSIFIFFAVMAKWGLAAIIFYMIRPLF